MPKDFCQGQVSQLREVSSQMAKQDVTVYHIFFGTGKAIALKILIKRKQLTIINQLGVAEVDLTIKAASSMLHVMGPRKKAIQTPIVISCGNLTWQSLKSYLP